MQITTARCAPDLMPVVRLDNSLAHHARTAQLHLNLFNFRPDYITLQKPNAYTIDISAMAYIEQYFTNEEYFRCIHCALQFYNKVPVNCVSLADIQFVYTYKQFFYDPVLFSFSHFLSFFLLFITPRCGKSIYLAEISRCIFLTKNIF